MTRLKSALTASVLMVFFSAYGLASTKPTPPKPGAYAARRIPLATSSAEILSGIHYEDDTGKIFAISQTSEPDDVCGWLGYSEALHSEFTETLEAGKALLENGKVSFEQEKTAAYRELVCTVKSPKDKLRPYVDSKALVKKMTIELRGLEVIRVVSPKFQFYFSSKSDLPSICSLFGYSKAVSSTLRSQRVSFSELYVVKIDVDSKGLVTSYSVDYVPSGGTIRAGEYIENVTCEK